MEKEIIRYIGNDVNIEGIEIEEIEYKYDYLFLLMVEEKREDVTKKIRITIEEIEGE
jgi:hypothetical protein